LALLAKSGAKLAPFDWGGCLLELPCETDDALQQKIVFVNIFPKKIWGGGKSKKIFPDIQKRGQKNFSGQKPVKLKVKNIFSDIHQFNYR
jgi:hypothetical protein